MVPIAGQVIITLVFMALLLLLSALPSRARPGDSGFVRLVAVIPPPVQKTLHVCLYAVLAFLWAWTLGEVDGATIKFLVPILVAVGFGAAMEGLQTLIPGRVGSWHDVLLNGVGAGAGLLAAILLLH